MEIFGDGKPIRHKTESSVIRANCFRYHHGFANVHVARQLDVGSSFSDRSRSMVVDPTWYWVECDRHLRFSWIGRFNGSILRTSASCYFFPLVTGLMLWSSFGFIAGLLLWS